MMGAGATFEQIGFSQVAQRGLRGVEGRSPDPAHMALFFAQLMKAGERHQSTLPFTKVFPLSFSMQLLQRG